MQQLNYQNQIMKTLIIDDEKNSRELMHTLLKAYCPEVEEITMSGSASEALFEINKINPDLIFLDIEMPDMNGFELLDKLDNDAYMICFATGYEEFAMKAINYGAFGYLLKPIDLDELKKVVIRAAQKIESEKDKETEALIVNQGKTIWVIRHKDIIHIEAYGNLSIIYRSEEKIVSDFSLNQLEQLLPDWIKRCHRSHMVNTHKIVQVKEGRTGLAVMEGGQEIPIASRRIKEFKDSLK